MDRSTLQLGLTILTLLAVAVVGVRQQGLSQRLAVLEAQPATAPAAQSAAMRPERRQAMRAMRMGAEAASSGAPASGEAPAGEEVIQDALWSEEGRSAIDEVVAEREEAERARQSERWQKMRQRYTERAVDDLADEYQLTDAVADELVTLLNDYSDIRTQRWEAMQSDEEVDLDALEAESEAAREKLEADITALAGAEVYEALEEMYRGGRGRR